MPPDSWLHGPAPFNQPFFIALTQALGVNGDAVTSSTPFPDTTQVNWVRAWAPAPSRSFRPNTRLFATPYLMFLISTTKSQRLR